MRNCQRVLERVLREHKEWLSRSEEFLERQTDYLRSDLSQPQLAVPGSVADSLQGIGYYWGVKGVVGGWTAEAKAARYLGRSIEYYFWSLLIRAQERRAGGPDFSNYVALLAAVICSGIAYEQDNITTPMAQLLLRVASSKQLVEPREWEALSFEPFALRLWSLVKSSELPSAIISQDVGVYAELLRPGMDEEAIRQACDYHCSNIEDRGRGRAPEFKDPPFDLLPVDLLAAFKVWRGNGVTVNEPDHPLLKTPLIVLPVEFTEETDLDLERVRSYYVTLELSG